MDKSIDKKVSDKIKALLDKYRIDRYIIADLLNISASSFNDILSNKSPWRLQYLSKLALYFSMSLDELVFGDKDYIEKTNKKYNIELKKFIKNYLVKNKKYEAYGRLTANGFFEDIEPKKKT